MLKQPTIRIGRDDGLGQDNPSFVIDGSYWSVAKDGLEGFDGLAHEVSTGEYAQYDGGYLLAERTGTVDRTISALSGSTLSRSRLPRARRRRSIGLSSASIRIS